MTMIPFGTRLIGQTEKTLSAILDRLLDGSGVTEPQWVALTLTLHGESAQPGDVAALVQRGFVAEGEVSRAGREFHAGVQNRAVAITGRLWSDLPASELETAARVLNVVLGRARQELAALG